MPIPESYPPQVRYGRQSMSLSEALHIASSYLEDSETNPELHANSELTHNGPQFNPYLTSSDVPMKLLKRVRAALDGEYIELDEKMLEDAARFNEVIVKHGDHHDAFGIVTETAVEQEMRIAEEQGWEDPQKFAEEQDDTTPDNSSDGHYGARIVCSDSEPEVLVPTAQREMMDATEELEIERRRAEMKYLSRHADWISGGQAQYLMEGSPEYIPDSQPPLNGVRIPSSPPEITGWDDLETKQKSPSEGSQDVVNAEVSSKGSPTPGSEKSSDGSRKQADADVSSDDSLPKVNEDFKAFLKKYEYNSPTPMRVGNGRIRTAREVNESWTPSRTITSLKPVNGLAKRKTGGKNSTPSQNSESKLPNGASEKRARKGDLAPPTAVDSPQVVNGESSNWVKNGKPSSSKRTR